MKTIYTTLFAFLFTISAAFALDNTKDVPTGSSKADNKETKKETTSANSTKSSVASSTKIINGKDLHKLKFPKKYASKKTKYSFKK